MSDGQENFIPLSVPHFQGNEWQYVKECLDTEWVSSVGSYVDRIEKDFAAYLDLPHAVAAASGTAALHVALMVAGIKPDDEVIVSDLTFIAPAFAVRYVGAWPVLMDVEPDYWQMDPAKLERFLAEECRRQGDILVNRTSGRPMKAVLPVNILGHPADLEPIRALAREYGLTVIEDASESLGAKYKDQRTGRFGDIACFSFNGNKIITTGGGGMLVTSREDLAARAKHLTTQAKADKLEFVHDEVGYNYRLTNLAAALGCAQLEQLDDYVAIKRRIAQDYTDALQDIPGLTPPSEAPHVQSTFWLYTILLDPKQAKLNSRSLLRHLGERKIQTRPFWQPLHLSPSLKGCQAYQCQVSGELFAQGLQLPCSVGLSQTDQQRVIETVRAALA